RPRANRLGAAAGRERRPRHEGGARGDREALRLADRSRPARAVAARRAPARPRPEARPLPLPGDAVSPGPAALLLAAVGAAALLADRTASVAALAILLLVACLRGAGRRAWPFLPGVGRTAAAVPRVPPRVRPVR